MAALSRLHSGQESQRKEHRALGVDVEGAVDVGIRLLGKRLVIGDDAGVVDEDVHVPAANLGGLEGGVNRCGVGNIGLETVHVAELGKFLYGGGDGLLVDVPDNYLFGVLFQTTARHDFPNPGAGSGDKDGFPRNLHVLLKVLADIKIQKYFKKYAFPATLWASVLKARKKELTLAKPASSAIPDRFISGKRSICSCA